MKFGPLIEYNLRNIFLEKSYTTCGGETICRPKNQNRAYLWINILKLYIYIYIYIYFVFIFWQVEELVSLPHFLHDFWIKMFLLIYYFTWPNFNVWLLLLLEILGNMCIVILCCPDCDVINFEINLIFLIKTFFLHDQKVNTKI